MVQRYRNGLNRTNTLAHNFFVEIHSQQKMISSASITGPTTSMMTPGSGRTGRTAAVDERQVPKKQPALPVTAIDLFCGAGGLTHGLRRGGIEVTAGIDIDPACRYPFEANNGAAKFLERDVKDLELNELAKYFRKGKYRLLAGCAPCQPFSTYSHGRDTTADGKWGLLKSFGKMVKEMQPDLVTMENVPQLPKHAVFDEFLKAFAGYHTWYGVVACTEYGVPQTRKRLVFLASKLGPIKLIEPTHKGKHKTVRDVIGSLPSIGSGEQSIADPLHAASQLSAINLARIKQSKPGGSWRDWDDKLVAECHKRESGRSYPSVYGRMEWDAPAPTMTTLCFGFGNGRFGHPTQHRGISLREAAIFQTFPANYKFVQKGEPIFFRTVGRLIGNAVPVRLGEVIASSIRAHLTSVAASAKTSSSNRRKESESRV